MTLGGMFRLINNTHISTYNNINADLHNYKQFDLASHVRQNQHGNYEVVFNLTDAALLGSDELIEPLPIV